MQSKTITESTPVVPVSDSDVARLLKKCWKNRSKPDMHSFVGKTKDGVVSVDCEYYGVNIYYDVQGKREYFLLNFNSAAEKLMELGLRLDTVEI